MIKEFQGEYRWLSNFYPSKIEDGEYIFQSVEHAYQSYKSDDSEWKLLCAYGNLNPWKIKRLSKSINPKRNWKNLRVEIMYKLLLIKFYQEPFKTLLIETVGMEIQEGNLWGDTFWGVDLRTGKGKNILGNLIMQIRGGFHLERFFGG